MRGILLSLSAFLLCVPAISGQTARSSALDAGDVATIVLKLPAPAGVDSAVYTVELKSGYRTFVPTRSRIVRQDSVFIIPLTFATPPRLSAGDQLAGHLQLVMEGHEPLSRALYVRVRERREIGFHLDLVETTVPVDGVTSIPYRLYNRGNRADTVTLTTLREDGWALLDSPRLILQPGDSIHGGLRLAAPTTVEPGDRQLFLVSAQSGGGEQTRTVNVVVVSATGWVDGLAHLPSSLFVGQALGVSSGTVAALSGGGRVAPNTDVRLDVRYNEGGVLDPALQRELAGARLRLAIDRPDLRLAAGDVYNPRNTLTGAFLRARGVQADYDPSGPLAFSAFAAVPSGFSGESTGGHILQGGTTLTTGYGAFGVFAGDMLQPGVGSIATARSTGAGLRWGGVRGAHSGNVEASLVRLGAGDTAERTGPAFELEYQLEHSRLSGRLRARRMPDAATTAGGQGNEVSGSLSAEVLPSIHAVGWAYSTEQNQLGSQNSSRSAAANVGLRGRVGRVQLQLAGTLMERKTTTAIDAFDFRRSTVRADGSFAHGPFSIQSELEVGTSVEFGREGGYQAAGSSVRWYSGVQSAWVRAHHARRPGGVSATTFQMGGSLEAGPVSLAGGLNRSISGIITTTTFWSSSEIAVQRNLTLQLGASARPAGSEQEWSFSVGLRRRLNLPIPIMRHPDILGVVFDDANANGVRDHGERAVPGVTLALGYLETQTDEAGEFRFRDATGTPLRVRPGSVPLGYVLSPTAVLPSRGSVAIPLLRTASITLDLFLDRDEDGQRDRAESVGAGVNVTVTDEHGRRRSATADEDGRVRITGLMPGRYAVTARPPGEPAAGVEPEVLMDFALAPGAEVHHTIAVPLRRRTIRMQGGGDFQLFR